MTQAWRFRLVIGAGVAIGPVGSFTLYRCGGGYDMALLTVAFFLGVAAAFWSDEGT